MEAHALYAGGHGLWRESALYIMQHGRINTCIYQTECWIEGRLEGRRIGVTKSTVSQKKKKTVTRSLRVFFTQIVMWSYGDRRESFEQEQRR